MRRSQPGGHRKQRHRNRRKSVKPYRLPSSAESLAERLAYQLVWQNIQQSSQQVDGDYLDGLSEVGLRAAFSPESDFYLDADGNIVFFIQAGVVAGEVAGILTFPFSSAELLSAA